MRTLRLILLLALLAQASSAQTPNIGGAMTPNAPPFVIQPPITPGDCVVWVNTYTVGDSGSPCGTGGGGTACTAGAFDLSLTTGCNVPFYVGGVFP